MSRMAFAAGHPPASPGAVSATNFQDSPYRAWGFHHVRQLLPGHHHLAQWYTHRAHPHRPFFTLGAFGQTVYVDPVAETVIAKLSCHPAMVDAVRFDEMFCAFRAICDRLEAEGRE